MSPETLHHQFLWFDVETTTIDPHKGAILEVACALCDDAPGGDFEIVDAWEAVAAGDVDGGSQRFLPDGGGVWIDVPSGVWQMHSVNGLWVDTGNPDALPIAEIDRQLVAWVKERGAKGKIKLAGFSVHFDLGWARVHLPHFAKLLRHQVFNVSTLLDASALWATEVKRPDVIHHRALADVVASIDAARRCRDSLLAGEGGS